jgi:hypothetical protein
MIMIIDHMVAFRGTPCCTGLNDGPERDGLRAIVVEITEWEKVERFEVVGRMRRKEGVDLPECEFVNEVIAWVGRAAAQDQHSNAVVPADLSALADLGE